jgi:4-hydroxybenzoate polyprenyltransferase
MRFLLVFHWLNFGAVTWALLLSKVPGWWAMWVLALTLALVSTMLYIGNLSQDRELDKYLATLRFSYLEEKKK